MPDTITIIDDRTGKQVTVPISDNIFPASAVRELDPSLFIYDPAFLQTAACKSAITYLDGDGGNPALPRVPIEQLAEHSTYLEVAYLLLNGELPNAVQLEQWKADVTHHTFIHENMRKRFVDGFHYDAHPMGMLVSSIAALGTFYNDAKEIHDADSRNKQILRLIAKMPTLAAMCYRFSRRPAVRLPRQQPQLPGQLPQHDVEDRRRTRSTRGSNGRWRCCSSSTRITSRTAAPRPCASSAPATPIPYSATASAASALYGPLHGGANEQVVRMLTEIGSIDHVPAFLDDVKSRQGPQADGVRPQGLQELRPAGHHHQEDCVRRLRSHRQEPTARHRLEARRSRAQRRLLHQPQAVPQRRLLQRSDLPGTGFPVAMFTVLFAIPRTSGWLAHWQELLGDKDQKISRPRQWYTGTGVRDYVPIAGR